jgi:hypothetical protein
LALRGYFQSPLYFDHHRKRIVRSLRLPTHLERAARTQWDRLVAAAGGDAANLVAVHVRRTDYAHYTETHPMLEPEYYVEAAQMV